MFEIACLAALEVARPAAQREHVRIQRTVVLAQEPRLKAAVLGGGGLSPGPAPPEVDGFTFAPRVSAPVLMFNGHLDLIFDLERSQKPLFRMLGTPAEHKRHIVVPGGHGVFFEKRSQFIREVLDWFDRYLGPVP